MRSDVRMTGTPPGRASVPPPLEAGDLREIVMGAQDNLTTVLAVVLGVAIGSGDASTVALAGLAAGLAEAISMGGVSTPRPRPSGTSRPPPATPSSNGLAVPPPPPSSPRWWRRRSR
ncbi:MAG TPA: VIT1/CCC1 transporter family protein [Actinomycetota bacterium]|nr:VIT1/CCC1 transporter family protein [Actinomycetota bacterium]